MTVNDKNPDINALYMGLILSLEASAMQSLGKMVNPLSGKIEKDLGQARMTIDMLDMIEKKTSGNLTEEEEKLTRRALYQLRMNYLDEINAEKGQRSDSPEAQKKTDSDDIINDDKRETQGNSE